MHHLRINKIMPIVNKKNRKGDQIYAKISHVHQMELGEAMLALKEEVKVGVVNV
jgi:hypothetical protein